MNLKTPGRRIPFGLQSSHMCWVVLRLNPKQIMFNQMGRERERDREREGEGCTVVEICETSGLLSKHCTDCFVASIPGCILHPWHHHRVLREGMCKAFWDDMGATWLFQGSSSAC